MEDNPFIENPLLAITRQDTARKRGHNSRKVAIANFAGREVVLEALSVRTLN